MFMQARMQSFLENLAAARQVPLRTAAELCIAAAMVDPQHAAHVPPGELSELEQQVLSLYGNAASTPKAIPAAAPVEVEAAPAPTVPEPAAAAAPPRKTSQKKAAAEPPEPKAAKPPKAKKAAATDAAPKKPKTNAKATPTSAQVPTMIVTTDSPPVLVRTESWRDVVYAVISLADATGHKLDDDAIYFRSISNPVNHKHLRRYRGRLLYMNTSQSVLNWAAKHDWLRISNDPAEPAGARVLPIDTIEKGYDGSSAPRRDHK